MFGVAFGELQVTNVANIGLITRFKKQKGSVLERLLYRLREAEYIR